MKAIWNRQVIADSEDTIFLEGNHYFPPETVAMDHLRAGTRQYVCHWKGEAKYWDVIVGDEVNENSAWSYPSPKPAAAEITGYIAFETSKGIRIEA